MKAYSKEQQEELLRIAKEKYGMQYPCDLYGRFPWDTEARGKQKPKYISLSKSSLGTFTYEVLIRGGDITNFYVFALGHGSSVFPRVRLTMEARDDMVEKTGYQLNAPPVAHLN